MNVCLLTWWGDSLTYTVARALSANGHTVDIFVTDRERHLGAKWGISARIREVPGVKLTLEADALSQTRYDLLIIQSFPRILAHRTLVAQLAGRATHVTLISFGDLLRAWRDAMRLQIGELRTVLPFVRKLRTVAYKDDFHVADLFAWAPRRVRVGFDVHSKFLHVDSLFRQIHALDWAVDAERVINVNFVGSRDPGRRGAALDQIDRFLTASGARSRHADRIMWRVYSDDEPGALPESEFVDILSNSDFTLAPPGHSLVTHRPIEALLRGSIPILNESEAPIYEIALRDGENCLLVRNNDWAAAVSRALDMSQAEITRMRAAALAMNDSKLRYGELSKAIARRVGVAA
jgi:hypothetical protein